MAGGVAAAFECKTTLVASHVTDAVNTAVEIRKHLPERTGTPYKELNSSIIYGLLAHSHSWKGKNSKPEVNIENALLAADKAKVAHPIQCLDFITVSDLATWTSLKGTFLSPKHPFYDDFFAEKYGKNGSATSAYICAAINQKYNPQPSAKEDYLSPIGVLLTHLFSKLAWTFKDMRGLDAYFRRVVMSRGRGTMRLWPITIYSEGIRQRVFNGALSNGRPYDEWSLCF